MKNVTNGKKCYKGSMPKIPPEGRERGGKNREGETSLNKISIFEQQTPDFAWKLEWMNR